MDFSDALRMLFRRLDSLDDQIGKLPDIHECNVIADQMETTVAGMRGDVKSIAEQVDWEEEEEEETEEE